MIGVSHTACKEMMSFQRNLRSHSWSVFYFFKYQARVVIARKREGQGGHENIRVDARML